MGEFKELFTLDQLVNKEENEYSISTLRRWIRDGIMSYERKGKAGSYLVSWEEFQRVLNSDRQKKKNDKETDDGFNLITELKLLNVKTSRSVSIGETLTFDRVGEVFMKGYRGIRYRVKSDDVLVITTLNAGKHPYNDRWDKEKGFLMYTGEGQGAEPQKLTAGNLKLYNCGITKTPVSVVQKLEKGLYVYLGEFLVLGHHKEFQPNEEGIVREVFVFEMVPIIQDGVIPPVLPNLSKETYSEDQLIEEMNNLKNEMDREKITKETLTKRYARSRKLTRLLKKLYNFQCQLCDPLNPIPQIKMANGKNYVEMHHINGYGEVLNQKGDNQETGDFVIDNASNCCVCCVFHHKTLHVNYSPFKYDPKMEAFVSIDGKMKLPLYLKKHNIIVN